MCRRRAGKSTLWWFPGCLFSSAAAGENPQGLLKFLLPGQYRPQAPRVQAPVRLSVCLKSNVTFYSSVQPGDQCSGMNTRPLSSFLNSRAFYNLTVDQKPKKQQVTRPEDVGTEARRQPRLPRVIAPEPVSGPCRVLLPRLQDGDGPSLARCLSGWNPWGGGWWCPGVSTSRRPEPVTVTLSGMGSLHMWPRISYEIIWDSLAPNPVTRQKTWKLARSPRD